MKDGNKIFNGQGIYEGFIYHELRGLRSASI